MSDPVPKPVQLAQPNIQGLKRFVLPPEVLRNAERKIIAELQRFRAQYQNGWLTTKQLRSRGRKALDDHYMYIIKTMNLAASSSGVPIILTGQEAELQAELLIKKKEWDVIVTDLQSLSR